ncbi:MAG: hypothetical protein RIE53_09735 [Rhodothermales bacterium]
MNTAVQRVKLAFNREFGPLAHKFEFLVLEPSDARTSNDPRVYRPGVYVWTDGSNVIKVGRHFTNARKRAFEHIQDNTGGKMSGLESMDGAQLILITADPRDAHWAAALEVYLEEILSPEIKSQRKG